MPICPGLPLRPLCIYSTSCASRAAPSGKYCWCEAMLIQLCLASTLLQRHNSHLGNCTYLAAMDDDALKSCYMRGLAQQWRVICTSA